MNAHYAETLKSNQLKLTPRRRAILDRFERQGGCLTPEDVWKALKKQFKRLGLPSIYRNLETFSDCGILVRIDKQDRRLHYALCKGKHDKGHHHHIVCQKCGQVDDVEGCGLVRMDRVNGYKILKHTLQLEGICPRCR